MYTVLLQISVLAGHPHDGPLYKLPRGGYDYHSDVSDAYMMVEEGHSCAVQVRGTLYIKPLCLCPAVRPLWLSCCVHARSITKDDSQQRRRNFLDKLLHKANVGHTPSTVASTNYATTSANNWVISYKIPTYLSTENQLYYRSKFLAAVILHPAIDHMNTITSHPQINRQVQCFNWSIVAHLRLHGTEYQVSCNQYG